MSADEYEAIPEAEWKALATTETTHLTDEERDYLPHAWDEWIARVKRDAAREALAAAEHRATQAKARIRHLEATAQITVREALRAEAERDEWRQAALDERGAALDLLEQIKVRDRRIQAVQHLVDQADHAGDWTVTCTHLQRALDGLIEHADLLARCAETDAARGIGQAVAGFAEGRRDTHYPIPEETP